MTVRVKVCGLTRLVDAEACVEAGVDAIGLNFWPGSPRCVDADVARSIVQAVGGRLSIVGLFVDASTDEIRAMRERVGFDCIQLHGEEPPEVLGALLPRAFKALRVRSADVAERAARYAGELLLLDAYVPGQPGGTGATFDWPLAAGLAAARKVVVAGGLTPDNVAEAVRRVRPYGVDTASGVESSPGVKDPDAVRRFVETAKGGDG